MAEWFKVARQHVRAGTRLAINENTILTHGSVTSGRAGQLCPMDSSTLTIRARGPMSSACRATSAARSPPPETVVRILDRFAKFGKPIQVTEFDLPTADEQGQAEYTRDFLTAVFSHPATDAFTMWGFWEGRMWNPPAALIRKDWTLKPNGQAWMDLVLKQWWTDTTPTTGPDGACSDAGFPGRLQDYRDCRRQGEVRLSV